MPFQILIPLTPEEKEFQQGLSKKNSLDLETPNSFKLDIAWELANLTRIAYSDYELFEGSSNILLQEEEWGSKISQINNNNNLQEGLHTLEENPQRGLHTLEKDNYLYTSSKISSQRINDYFIGKEEKNLLAKIEEKYGDSFFRYKILSAYNYLSYYFTVFPNHFPAWIPIPEIDRFGFIAERKVNGEKLIFVVYRGTREPQEWFVNFQFKQRPFLESQNHIENNASKPEVSLGFNKIYTGFRPGLLNSEKKINLRLNKYSRFIDKKVRKKSEDKYPEIHRGHIPIKCEVERVFAAIAAEKNNVPTSVYFTGHSLGGALATISALHIAQLPNLRDSKIKNKIFLYTFASPRVGNDTFAKECNQSIQIYRITNSEDIVPRVPPGTFKIMGSEMPPNPTIIAFRKALSFLTNGITNDIYEHVGYPICFTRQCKRVTSNHNLNTTYCDALRSVVQSVSKTEKVSRQTLISPSHAEKKVTESVSTP